MTKKNSNWTDTFMKGLETVQDMATSLVSYAKANLKDERKTVVKTEAVAPKASARTVHPTVAQLRTLREAAGITTDTMGASLGVNGGYYRAMENGYRTPNAENLKKITAMVTKMTNNGTRDHVDSPRAIHPVMARLRTWRIANNISTYEMADRLDISADYYGKLENGWRSNPSAAVVTKIEVIMKPKQVAKQKPANTKTVSVVITNTSKTVKASTQEDFVTSEITVKDTVEAFLSQKPLLGSLTTPDKVVSVFSVYIKTTNQWNLNVKYFNRNGSNFGVEASQTFTLASISNGMLSINIDHVQPCSDVSAVLSSSLQKRGVVLPKKINKQTKVLSVSLNKSLVTQ